MKTLLLTLLVTLLTNLVSCGYLTGHHPLPQNVITSRTLVGGAVGGPPGGAYSSSQLTQTVASAPAQFQSSIATYHPIQYGYRGNQNQGGGYNQGSNQGGNQGSNQGYSQGYNQLANNPGQNQGNLQNNGYNTNIPSVLAYGSYGEPNQNQGYYQNYGNNGPNNYGRY
ncbi:unnamed protein product [Phyllotreta striolata]|uniref:Uncharacterized protein n=1 Tax=Phyllotreta striolata TaxID=444603 RepID=A0A9N9XL55_PHYSR|nr:unnamed protein product [Phyllotreta striolata]